MALKEFRVALIKESSSPCSPAEYPRKSISLPIALFDGTLSVVASASLTSFLLSDHNEDRALGVSSTVLSIGMKVSRH